MTELHAACGAAGVEALADRDRVEALWYSVRRLACWIARRYTMAAREFGAVDDEDLQQTAAVGMLRALKTWDPSAGSFTNWMGMHIRRECMDLLGLRGRIRAESYGTVPLNEPVDEDGTELIDLIPDSSPNAFEASEVRADILDALSRLPDDESAVIVAHDLNGEPLHTIALRELAEEKEIAARRRKALNRLRRDKVLRDTYAPTLLRYKGVAAYNSTFCSAVEDAVFQRAEYERSLAH